VDLVRLNGFGLRARGLLPDDPRAYVMFGDRVLAPCGGAVAGAADGAPDMPPPQPDRAHMAGNYVLLDCAGVHVLLGHLQRGSVAVRSGQTVRTGEVLGLVGNSGNTGEPHLHIHAQRPGSSAEPMSGEPLPIRLDGRYLVRNVRVTTARNPGASAR
jgi:murein DD-endopeptidase MepM/ murein hydrolase activator NlpD